MGLFGDKEPRQLEELLSAMHGSTLREIDSIRAGSPPTSSGPLAEHNLNNRISRAAALARKLADKGKQRDAERILAEWRSKPVPQMMFFRAEKPTKESFERAAVDAAAALDAAPPDPQQAAKDEQWRMVIDEIRRRARLG